MRKLQLLLPMLLLALFSFAQQKIITGRVTNKTTGEPLQGVSVQVNNKAAMTDADGKFSIQASAGQTISFSFVGMNVLKVKVGPTTSNLVLTMEEAANDLNQIVVTGYKVEKKIDLTGAVAIVNLQEVKNVPLASPMLALQGQVPGLYIQTDGSPTGANGGAPTIIIRGVNNLNGLGSTNPPLYVIDGVPTTRYEDFANLNTNSIASIQVLKDASASSIYGSRAANGVIIVTTKDGTTGSGEKVHIQFSSSITAQTERPWQEPVLNSTQRGAALWRAAVNDGTDPNLNSTSNIYQYNWNGNYNNAVLNNVIIAPYVGGDSLEPVSLGTNWQNALYKTAAVTSNDIAITAGTGKSGLLIDLGYYNNNGLMQFTKYQRYSARINTHTSAFNDRFRIGENVQFSRTSQVNSTTDVGGDAVGDLALTLAPTIPLYKTDGTYGGPIGAGYSDRNNPVDMQYLNRWNTTNLFLTTGNIFMEIEPIKNLVYRTSLGFDYSDGVGKVIKQTGDEGPVNSINSLALQESKEFTFTWSNTLTYNMVFGKSRINLLAGMEAVRDDYSTFGAANTNFAIQDVNYFVLSAGSGSQTNNGSATGYRLLSQFGKVFYSYADKYLASATVRRDGSSRFGTNNPYGVFPAFTLGWRINNEDFFKEIAAKAAVSNLKLRAGIGTVGNSQFQGSNQAGNLAAYTLYYANYGTASSVYPEWLNTGTAYDIYGVNTGTLPSGFVQTQLGNPNLKWESTTETNVGLDFGFFNEKISGSFDYFNRNTSNILIQPPIPGAVGEGQLSYVNGASKNTKGWEMILSYHNKTSWGLGYSVTGNASHWVDKITALPEDVRAAYPGDLNHSIIGHSQFSIFGYETDGIFKNQQAVDAAPVQPGDGVGRIKYKDLDGNDTVNVLDQTWLGTTLPKLEYGIRIDLNYKGFDLSIFGSGVAGKTGFDPVKFMNSFVDTRNNYGPGVLNAWTPQNPNSGTPALSILNLNAEDRTSNFYYVNASYFKIRNVTIGYNLPKNIASAVKMEGLRIYVAGQNLLAFKHKAFLSKDPERANSFAIWPVPTSYTFGINASF